MQKQKKKREKKKEKKKENQKKKAKTRVNTPFTNNAVGLIKKTRQRSLFLGWRPSAWHPEEKRGLVVIYSLSTREGVPAFLCPLCVPLWSANLKTIAD